MVGFYKVPTIVHECVHGACAHTFWGNCMAYILKVDQHKKVLDSNTCNKMTTKKS